MFRGKILALWTTSLDSRSIILNSTSLKYLGLVLTHWRPFQCLLGFLYCVFFLCFWSFLISLIIFEYLPLLLLISLAFCFLFDSFSFLVFHLSFRSGSFCVFFRCSIAASCWFDFLSFCSLLFFEFVFLPFVSCVNLLRFLRLSWVLFHANIFRFSLLRCVFASGFSSALSFLIAVIFRNSDSLFCCVACDVWDLFVCLISLKGNEREMERKGTGVRKENEKHWFSDIISPICCPLLLSLDLLFGDVFCASLLFHCLQHVLFAHFSWYISVLFVFHPFTLLSVSFCFLSFVFLIVRDCFLMRVWVLILFFVDFLLLGSCFSSATPPPPAGLLLSWCSFLMLIHFISFSILEGSCSFKHDFILVWAAFVNGVLKLLWIILPNRDRDSCFAWYEPRDTEANDGPAAPSISDGMLLRIELFLSFLTRFRFLCSQKGVLILCFVSRHYSSLKKDLDFSSPNWIFSLQKLHSLFISLMFTLN